MAAVVTVLERMIDTAPLVGAVRVWQCAEIMV